MSLSIILLSTLIRLTAPNNLGQLEINITGMQSNKGTIHIAIYDNAEAFPKERQFIIKKFIPAKQSSITITDLPFGNYAIAAYHDTNSNEKLDKNIFGIPTEPYAFSNGIKPKWKRPIFKEAKFQFNQSKLQLKLQLCKWKDL